MVEMSFNEKDRNIKRRVVEKRSGDNEMAEEEEEESKESSIEEIFSTKEVPPWQKQVTLRALVVSFVLSILFTFIVMKLNLTTGIIPSLNVSAGLLGFFFVKTWTKFLEKFGMLRQPFTRQENTVIQTCVVASSGIAFSGMLPLYNINIIPATFSFLYFPFNISIRMHAFCICWTGISFLGTQCVTILFIIYKIKNTNTNFRNLFYLVVISV